MLRTLSAAVLALSLTVVNVAPSLAIGTSPGSMRLLEVDPHAFISVHGAAMAPIGHVVFCAKQPDQCMAQNEGADYVKFNRTTKWLLASVNRRINRHVRPVNDAQSSFGDVWAVATVAGDCEDSALAKRAELLRLGFPPAAMRIGIGTTPGGYGHAVLIVRTTKGDFVLDNRHNTMRTWQHSDLHWAKIQSARDPRRWYSVSS